MEIKFSNCTIGRVEKFICFSALYLLWTTMERFDVLVIGSGSGMIVASAAAANGLKTAVVDKDPMGGTCLNRGCVPSKMLIHPADVVRILADSQRIGVNATLNSVNFKKIMDRMHRLVSEDSGSQAASVKITPGLTWFRQIGEFVSDYTMRIGRDVVQASKIFIASGARPEIPRFKGIEKVDFLTSDSVLEVNTPPRSILIVGGGYIGTEYAHFFSGIGAKSTVIQRPQRLIPNEEPEVSDLLKGELEKRMHIFTGFEVVELKQEGKAKVVIARNLLDGEVREFSAEALMIAAGRIPNSDMLKPEKTGVKLDNRGFVEVNEYLETSKKSIWAFGDAIGREMFKHVANFEAGVAWHNAVHDHKTIMDYTAAPHAVFTYPQVASVGLKENEAKQKGYQVLVGKALYKDTAMGAAMGEPEGFVKVIVESGTGKILGGHIIGPEASNLVQEITNAMNTETGTYAPILQAMHIHPALCEVVQRAFGNLHPA
jgi:dihydrolipoamide dehydrogenase